ncbi:MAG: hypothetical protein MJZ55_01035, partial [Paludibacteraceae bacterium]|nr:hypothetical protein [Paludibacteraceae bacterium]
MMLQAKTYKKILLASLLCAAAQQVSAKDDVEFSYKGVFSIEPGKAVVFATTNCKNTGVDTERFQWQDGGKYAGGEDHVLSSDEWTYLIVTRDADKEQKDALGTVMGEKGLILLPDNWVQPEGVPAFQPVTKGAHYENNVYTAEQWEKMEDAGAIFLPCRGYAYDDNGHHVVNEDDHGVYWARDQYDSGNGYCLRFDNEAIHDKNHGSKQNYYSVRLV